MSTQPGLTPQELDRLQRLRASVLAFQSMIAPLSAEMQNNAYNEQFNQLQQEAKALLKDPDFDKKVARALTEDVLTERSQKVIFPRLTAIGILGVVLALAGLGVNSIVLDDVVVNSAACCVSSGGMLLVVGAFLVWGVVNTRRRISNMGDLYLRCENLLHQINHALNMAIPASIRPPAGEVPPVPSVIDLTLDSLQKQSADWQRKLQDLTEQRRNLGPDAPLELTLAADFVERELNRVKQEIDRWRGQAEPAAAGQAEGAPDIAGRVAPPVRVMPARSRMETPPPVPEEPDSQAIRRARSVTMDMPPVESGEELPPAEDEPRPTDEQD